MTTDKIKPVKVSIKNFQSVSDIEFEIHGFTCITGPTNIGKSAIIRAISSAILNKSTIGIVRKGKKYCTVELAGDEWGMKWEKGDGVGRYWVPGEEKARTGIGQGQTELTEKLGFKSIKVGDDVLSPWLATQFDPIFLLNKSGPAVTNFISDISRLKVLQDAIVINARTKQRSLAEANSHDEELVSITARESKLDGLDNLLAVEQDLIAELESLKACSDKISKITVLSGRMDSESEVLKVIVGVKDVRVPASSSGNISILSEANKKNQELEKTALSIASLRTVSSVVIPDASDGAALDRIKDGKRMLEIEPLSNSVKVLQSSSSIIIPVDPELDISRLQTGARIASEITSLQRSISLMEAEVEIPAPVNKENSQKFLRARQLLSEITAAEKDIKKGENSLKQYDDELQTVLDELSKIPTCPTCQQVCADIHSHNV
jgi:hypothetical protein